MMMMSSLSQTNTLSRILIVLAHGSNSCCVLGGEAVNTNYIVFGLIRPRLEPRIYHTREKKKK